MSKRIKSYFGNIPTVDLDTASRNVYNSEKSLDDGAFAGTCERPDRVS